MSRILHCGLKMLLDPYLIESATIRSVTHCGLLIRWLSDVYGLSGHMQRNLVSTTTPGNVVSGDPLGRGILDGIADYFISHGVP